MLKHFHFNKINKYYNELLIGSEDGNGNSIQPIKIKIQKVKDLKWGYPLYCEPKSRIFSANNVYTVNLTKGSATVRLKKFAKERTNLAHPHTV